MKQLERYCRTGQNTDDNMGHALVMLVTYDHKHTHSEYVTLLFNHNNGCTNAPQCYVKRILSVLL